MYGSHLQELEARAQVEAEICSPVAESGALEVLHGKDAHLAHTESHRLVG